MATLPFSDVKSRSLAMISAMLKGIGSSKKTVVMSSKFDLVEADAGFTT
jgi:arginine utilization protein RocB